MERMKGSPRIAPSCLLVSLHVLTACVVYVGGITDNGFVIQVQGVAGHSVDLPCDLSTHSADDQAVLVLWYKDDNGTPLYNFDARGESTFSEGSVERDPARGSPVEFVSEHEPPALRLHAVSSADEALYRCRVDFRSSPTRNQRVNLTVIIPPNPPEILLAGQTVIGRIGPLEEGAPLHLTCLSDGGNPTPRVTWLRDGREVNASSAPSSDGRVYCELHLPPLTRADLRTRLTCAATNTNAVKPATSSVELDLYFRPLSVEMLGSSLNSMSSEQSYDLLCRSYGSRPPANISWWIGGTQLTGNKHTGGVRSNVSSSSVSLRPSAAQHGLPLVCRAENDRVTNGVIEDRRILNVRYAPRVSIRLGNALDPNKIQEGADAYFDCNIEANPKIYSVKWSHEGVPVEASAQLGVSDMITISDRSLVIRNLSRRTSGAYRCSAANPEGEGVSRPVQLTVRYAPVCKPDQPRRYGVTRSQPTQVTCQVDANPPQVTFAWRFNTSLETLDLSDAQVTSDGLSSKISFLPRPDQDYGQMICMASNEIGRMAQPCLFSVAAAGRPEPPRNCLVLNQTSESLSVRCEAGFDGGLSQRFVAELREASGQRLLRNLTQPQPRFSVRQLPAGLRLRLEVYAVNGRGRSAAVTVEGLTLQPAEKRISSDAGTPKLQEIWMPTVVGVLIGGVLSLLLIAVGVVVCLKSSHAARKSEAQADLVTSALPVKVGPGSGAVAASSQAPYRPVISPDTYHCEPDDSNPDVVPTKHEYCASEMSGLTRRRAEVMEAYVSLPTFFAPSYASENDNAQPDTSAMLAELTLPRSRDGSACLRERPRAHDWRSDREHDGAVLYATLRRGRDSSEAHSCLTRTVRSDTDQESVV